MDRQRQQNQGTGHRQVWSPADGTQGKRTLVDGVGVGNHAYAGHEFPRSQLPPKYRKQGLRFKDTGYPDFEPYAMVLPNGQKKVKIALTGSRTADETAANAAMNLKDTPRYYTWHHNEDLTMSLVPEDLHEAAEHSGGVAEYKHRTGVAYAR